MAEPNGHGNGNGNNTEARFARIDGKFEAVDARLDGLGERMDSLDETMTDGFRLLGQKLDGHNERAAVVGKFTSGQIAGGVTTILVVGGALVGVGLYVMRAEIGDVQDSVLLERTERSAADRIDDIARRAAWEIHRAHHPVLPEYPFGETP